MAKNEERSEPNWKDRIAVKYTEIKEHVRKNKTTYTVGAGGVVLCVITFVVTKRIYSPQLIGKIVIKDSVLWIQTNSRRTGPPSWMVRRDDGLLFRSQTQAAKVTNVPREQFSSYFNGGRNNVGGHQWERVAIETPRPR